MTKKRGLEMLGGPAWSSEPAKPASLRDRKVTRGSLDRRRHRPVGGLEDPLLPCRANF